MSRRGTAIFAAGALLPLLFVSVGPAWADEQITGTSPLTMIETSSTLNCDVRYESDASPEFYGATACGTLLMVDGVLYGPSTIPAGSSASPRTTFSPVSQRTYTDSTDEGGEHLVIETIVNAGDSGVQLRQRDRYWDGDSDIHTEVLVRNLSNRYVSGILYRAGDCFLGDSDFGYGAQGPGWVACTSRDTDRAIMWTDDTKIQNFGVSPMLSPAQRYEAYYDELWAKIGAQKPFENMTTPNEYHDNAAGLSWSFTLTPVGTDPWDVGFITSLAKVEHTIGFGATRKDIDTDGDGLTDEQEETGITVQGRHIDLKAMGADPKHKDLFLKLDWMDTDSFAYAARTLTVWGTIWQSMMSIEPGSTKPSGDDVKALIQAFKNAPVDNPDGQQGINLHVDVLANGLVHEQYIYDPAGDSSVVQAARYRAERLNPAERKVYRYGLIASQMATLQGDEVVPSSSSGQAELPGTTFVVARNARENAADKNPLTSHDKHVTTSRALRGTIMHEFGHTLGLGHGGSILYSQAHRNRKPEYASVMNYSYQLNAGATSCTEGAATRINNRLPQIDFSNSEGIEPVPSECWPTALVQPPWLKSDYEFHRDWQNLLYGAGIGDLTASGVFESIVPEEAPLEEIWESAPDGAGYAELLAPTLLLVNDQTTTMRLRARIVNLSSRDAVYELSWDGDLDISTMDVNLAPRDVMEVELVVNPQSLSDEGRHTGWLTLTEVDAGVVSQTEHSIDVIRVDDEEATTALKAFGEVDINDLPDWVSRESLDGLIATLQEIAEPEPRPSPTATPSSSPSTSHSPSQGTELPDIYTTPGLHNYNGRNWWTLCEPYSQTHRCRTDIWSTQVSQVKGKFVQETSWHFNNLTYLSSPRSLWTGNSLGFTNHWTSPDDREWYTECDTAATGRNGCRSYIRASVIAAVPKSGGGVDYKWIDEWIFNNMVLFS